VKPGVYAYIGAPGTGKTTLARAEWEAVARAQRWPGIAIDSAATRVLSSLPAAASVNAALEAAYARGSLVRWTPATAEEVETLARAVRTVGRCALLVDEIAFWGWKGELMRLARTWRHAPTSLHVTGHHVGKDLAQSFLACGPSVRVFRLSAPRSVEFFMRWKGLDPEKVRALPVGKYVVADL
jgi:hypothetical protein